MNELSCVAHTVLSPSAVPETVAELVAAWDAAEARSDRARLVPLLQKALADRDLEDRVARDYLTSLRAGDRHLAEVLEVGSPRVVAAYAQFILRRMRHGQGVARYAVRHLARRGDGLALLRGVVVSEHFGPHDILTVLEHHPARDVWALALPRLAQLGVLPPCDDEGLSACLVHPDPAVRALAAREGRGVEPSVSWERMLSRWAVALPTPEAVREAAEAWGHEVVVRHGRWLHALEKLSARIDKAPTGSRALLDAVVTQEWQGDRVVFRMAPAPLGSRPRLAVTLRDAEGRIVDLFRLSPIRFDDAVAIFEAWLVGKRSVAVRAEGHVA